MKEASLAGNSTKAPTAGEDERGESAGSQHDEDYMANLKETQGKAGTTGMLLCRTCSAADIAYTT